MTAPQLATFTPRQNMVAVGADATVRAQLIEIVKATSASAPRTLQKQLGPSEIGERCTRKIAYKVAAWPEPPQAIPWWAIMGTAFHAWIADGLEEQNRLYKQAGLEPRWLVERRVEIRGIFGTLDACDLVTGTVIDHKLLGKKHHDEIRTQGIDVEYFVQINAYAEALRLAGFKVNRVAVACYPRFAEITKGMHVWSDVPRPEVAYKALDRVEKIREAVRKVNPYTDPEKFKLFKSVPSTKCEYCPWLSPGPDNGALCPGNLN